MKISVLLSPGTWEIHHLIPVGLLVGLRFDAYVTTPPFWQSASVQVSEVVKCEREICVDRRQLPISTPHGLPRGVVARVVAVSPTGSSCDDKARGYFPDLLDLQTHGLLLVHPKDKGNTPPPAYAGGGFPNLHPTGASSRTNDSRSPRSGTSEDQHSRRSRGGCVFLPLTVKARIRRVHVGYFLEVLEDITALLVSEDAMPWYIRSQDDSPSPRRAAGILPHRLRLKPLPVPLELPTHLGDPSVAYVELAGNFLCRSAESKAFCNPTLAVVVAG